MPKDNKKICLYCSYFRNSPAYIEEVFHGLTSLSSAYSSIRKDDGICAKNDEYLSAYYWCGNFKAAER
ncbi:MAG TPA: hypothetical protein ENK33_03810 [Desulfobacterales bacterium]|nr:hypothetical protein [Desulfobacterales bacterium]